MKLACLAVLLALPIAVQAKSPPPVAAEPAAQPQFCPHAAFVAASINQQITSDMLDTARYGRPVSTIDVDAAVRDVYSQCHRGDAVMLERGTLVQRICDPAQPIQQVGRNAVCRLN